MKREDIRNAAMEFAYNTGETDFNAFSKGFFNGVRWRIDSVWHEKCDIPQPFRPCLVELREGLGGKEARYVAARRSEYEWIELTHYEHSQVHRWAYVSDLLPGTGKEADR